MEPGWIFVAASLIFLLAGVVKGVIGMGLPVVVMGGLALLMAPASAAALLIVPSLVTNIQQFAAGPAPTATFRRLLPVLAGLVAGTLAGILPRLGGHAGFAHVALGAVLVIYGLFGLVHVRVPEVRSERRWMGLVVGYLTGSVTAATGVSIVPLVPYLQALQLHRHDLVQAMGLAFTVSTIALAASLGLGPGLTHVELGWSVSALIPALLGMWIGDRIRKRTNEGLFRRWFFCGLVVLGAVMIVRAA